MTQILIVAGLAPETCRSLRRCLRNARIKTSPGPDRQPVYSDLFYRYYFGNQTSASFWMVPNSKMIERTHHDRSKSLDRNDSSIRRHIVICQI
jgi:hypothetical protein